MNKPKTPPPAWNPDGLHAVPHGERFAFHDAQGKQRGPAKWHIVWGFHRLGYAAAQDDKGLRLLDRNLKIRGNIFIYDNGPDDFQEGLIRLRTQGRKVRYFNAKTGKTLPGAWDYGTPFLAGKACVCMQCLRRVDDEYTEVYGGVGWVIDPRGRVLERLGKLAGGLPGKCEMRPHSKTPW